MAETLVCYPLDGVSQGFNDPIAQTKRVVILNSGMVGTYGGAPKVLKSIQIQQHLRRLAGGSAAAAPSASSGPVCLDQVGN